MKVIYAGFPKTGTKTINAALTELGFKCYDYIENYVYLGDEWQKIFDQGGSVEDFRRMFEDVDAIMDVPGCVFWEDIHEAFPDAKIIFSQRATEDEWFKSFDNQLQTNTHPLVTLIMMISPRLWLMNRYGLKLAKICFGINFTQHWFGGCKYSELIVRKSYRKHNAYVLEKAPKDKLHIVDFKKGWKPLCEFLGVPVPDTPFPHKNKKGAILKELMETDKFLLKAQREGMVLGGVLLGVLAFGGYKLINLVYNDPNVIFNCVDNVKSVVNSFR